MKELIRFDEETQKTFLKEVSGRQKSCKSLEVSLRKVTHVNPTGRVFEHISSCTGEGDALSGPPQCFKVHWTVL